MSTQNSGCTSTQCELSLGRARGEVTTGSNENLHKQLRCLRLQPPCLMNQVAPKQNEDILQNSKNINLSNTSDALSLSQTRE